MSKRSTLHCIALRYHGSTFLSANGDQPADHLVQSQTSANTEDRQAMQVHQSKRTEGYTPYATPEQRGDSAQTDPKRQHQYQSDVIRVSACRTTCYQKTDLKEEGVSELTLAGAKSDISQFDQPR